MSLSLAWEIIPWSFVSTRTLSCRTPSGCRFRVVLSRWVIPIAMLYDPVGVWCRIKKTPWKGITTKRGVSPDQGITPQSIGGRPARTLPPIIHPEGVRQTFNGAEMHGRVDMQGIECLLRNLFINDPPFSTFYRFLHENHYFLPESVNSRPKKHCQLSTVNCQLNTRHS